MGGMSTRNEIKARLGILAEPPAKARMGRWTLEDSAGWGDMSKQWTATINGTQWAIVVDGATGTGSLMRMQPGRAPQTVQRGPVEQLKRYAESLRASRPGAKAKMATARDVKEAKAAGLRVGDIVRYKDIVDPNDRKWRARIVELRGPRLLVSNDVMPEFRDWALPPSTSVMVDEVVKASRPGAKAKFASKRTTAGALRKQLRAQGITSPADLEWHGISASDPDNTPYWLHEDGSMEKIRASRPGAKAKMDLTDVQRKAGYKWRVAYTRQLGKDQYLGGPPVTMQDDLLFATESAARQWADTMLKKGWFKGQGGGPEKILKATVLMASRIGAKSTHEAPAQKPGRKVMAESDPAVSAKIRKLMAEGKPQKQAVAIALDMKRRGEI